MGEKINIAELLKDCPKGMELDSPVWNNIVFEEIDGDNIVIFRKSIGAKVYLTQYGEVNSIDGNCVIFPKGKTTWEGFVSPCKFKDGDIIFTHTSRYTWVSIFKQLSGIICCTYVDLCISANLFITDMQCLCHINEINTQRLATEEEKQKLFQAIKDNGYKWNAETKTLEKLTEQKFDITTLKPFDKVLVRDTNRQVWTADLFSHIMSNTNPNLGTTFVCAGHYPDQCIPFEGNEHLLGKTNDCSEYYKTWE